MADYLEIDWNSRQITIPDEIPCLGVYNDKDSNRVWFKCPVEYGDYKVADYGLHVNYTNTGISGQQYDGDIYDIDDAQVDGDEMTFSWLVGRRAYLEEGQTSFVVCCKIVDSDNNVVRELNTTTTSLPVLEGLELDKAPDETYPSYLDGVIRRCEAAEAAAEAATKVNENALVGVNVNGTPAEVEDHIAELVISNGARWYWPECYTDASELEKELEGDLPDEVTNGTTICVVFTEANRVSDISLIINGTKAPVYGDIAWAVYAQVVFVYLLGWWAPLYSPTFYAGECTTDASTPLKTITMDAEGVFYVRAGSRAAITFTKGNTADSNVRLCFNNSLPAPGYISGDTDWSAGDTVMFTFDGEYWVVE